LVHVGSGHPARLDERVEAFDGNLGASEPKMVQAVKKPLGIGEAREDKRGPQHGGSGSVDRYGWYAKSQCGGVAAERVKDVEGDRRMETLGR
jgi:hypothetical protein